MPQKQGSKISDAGRLDGTNGTAVTSANFAIGAGWGGTATFAIASGSTDQRGRISITASATTPAQATATVTLTFVDGAYAAAPFAVVLLGDNTQAVAEVGATDVETTTTTLAWTHSTLPVATKVYHFTYIVVA